MIPVSMGIVFLPMIIINGILLAYTTTKHQNLIYLFMFMFGMISMFFAGVLDDIVGNRDVSGLKGHFKSLLKGKLTTGGFKALFGGFVGIVISIGVSTNIGNIIINTLIIALSTNLMNLLDLRPGRAIKAYLVIVITIFVTLSGYIKAKNTVNKKKPSALKVEEQISPDGFKVLVGKNNMQNDYITTRIAEKTDVWFHTKEILGAVTLSAAVKAATS